MPLGRGLSSLIPPKITSTTIAHAKEQAGGVLEIAPDNIFPNPSQPREVFSHTELEELIASIKEYGVLQPLVVSDLGNGRYELIAGERRLRASKIAGLKTVPVIMKSPKAQEKLEWALIENLHRENLNPVEEAKAYRNLSEEFGFSQENIARKMGKSRSHISNTLRLLSLPEKVQMEISNKRIPPSSARLLVTMTPKEQELFLTKFLKGGMTVREVTREKKMKMSPAKSKDAKILAIEADLREILGTKVEVKKRGGRGQVVIDFYSEEEFTELLKKFGNL
jgi:ParB family chromosome partitioning protein